MEHGGTAAKPQKPEVFFADMTTIHNDNDFGATKNMVAIRVTIVRSL